MIISASYRTDIPAFFAPWFAKRFQEGFCRVVNPYGGQVHEIPLRDGVDGFVFWTRNAAPFLDALALVRAAGLPFVVQHTLTGYPRALEEAVIAPARALTAMRAVARRHGPRALVWRYDPIMVTSLTPPAWHEANFRRLAAALRGVVDEVVISHAHIYRKSARNLDSAARRHGFSWRDPDDEAKRALTARLAAIAAENGMALTVCSQTPYLAGGARPAACVDAQRLMDVGGRRFRFRLKGNRPGCACAESRDIGAYDSCAQGCAYCYAVSSRAAAKSNLARHDPDSPFLLPVRTATANHQGTKDTKENCSW